MILPLSVLKVRTSSITIVGFPKDVEETYFGEKGIIANSEDNAILIDMTTSSPKLAA